MRHWRLAFVGLLVLGMACSSPAAKPTPTPAQPDYLATATPEVKEMYAFALAHPEILSFIPCYCGCADTGDRSNRDCYVKQIQGDGTIVYNNHAYG